MRDVTSFRWDVWTYFLTLSQNFLSIFSGYPNSAVNNPYKSHMEGYTKILRQDLIREDFEDNHIFYILLDELYGNLEDFGRLDMYMGDWLLQQNLVTSKELVTRYDFEIHRGIFDKMAQKGVIFPGWLEASEYQEYLLQATPIIQNILKTIEIFEDQILVFPKSGKNETVILSNEWELRQRIKFFRWIAQKGIRNTFPDILETLQAEKNPLGWIKEDFSQRISDKIDEANASDPKEAIRILRSAIRLKPVPVQACTLYYSLAMRYEDLEKWEEAIEAYTKMLEVAPPNAVGMFNRAKIFHRLGRDEEAKQDLEEAISLPPLHIYVLSEEDRQEAQNLLNEIVSKNSINGPG